MTHHPDRVRWNERHAGSACAVSGRATALLTQYRHLLTGGVALDVACGRGSAVTFLAAQGYRVVGLDISDVGLAACRAATRDAPGRVHLLLADLDHVAIRPETFDCITMFFYHNPPLAPALVAGLRPHGLLIAQTFNARRLEIKPDFNPRYLLQTGELPRMFSDLTPLDARDGVPDHPEISYLVARKPG